MNGNDTSKVVALLEGQGQDLKAQLARADTEKAELLSLANNLQKQNEILMLPLPEKKEGGLFQDSLSRFGTARDANVSDRK